MIDVTHGETMIDAATWNREQATIALLEVIQLAHIDIERRRFWNHEHRADPSWRYVPCVTAANVNAILQAVKLLDRMWGLVTDDKANKGTVTFICAESEKPEKPSFETLGNCAPVPSIKCVERLGKQVLRSLRRIHGTAAGASVKNSRVPPFLSNCCGVSAMSLRQRQGNKPKSCRISG